MTNTASQWPSIAELAKQVQSGEVTATSLVEKALATIAEKEEYQDIIATTEESHMLLIFLF